MIEILYSFICGIYMAVMVLVMLAVVVMMVRYSMCENPQSGCEPSSPSGG